MKENFQSISHQFADLEEARSILCRRDEYMNTMQPFERALKMNTHQPVSEEDYLSFVSQKILEWNIDEREKLNGAMEFLNECIRIQKLPISQSIVFIKTTGQEEWNSAYTRSNAIVLPKEKLKTYVDRLSLFRLLAHELFHILTRVNPELKDALYKMIGFHRISFRKPVLPEIFKNRLLTNPDAPHHNHYISLEYQGKSVSVVPLMLLKENCDNVDSARDIMNSIKGHLFCFEEENENEPFPRQCEHFNCIDIKSVRGWCAQTGCSDTEVSDPEEILAEYFVDLLIDEPGMQMSEIHLKMKRSFDAS